MIPARRSAQKTTPRHNGGLRSRFVAALERLVDVHEGEGSSLIWSCLYFFSLLASYYIIRPVRDEMGLTSGVEQLPRLYIGTFVAMLVASPVFAALVSRAPRQTFIPLVNRFFATCLALFFAAMEWGPDRLVVPLARAFFVFASVFNLFVVSVFWGFMADIYRNEQGKRLFGLIGVGGTAGAIVGAAATAALVQKIGAASLLLVSAALLEVSVLCVRRLSGVFQKTAARAESDRRHRPRLAFAGALDGIRLALTSRYLAAICLFMFLYTLTSTFLYFEQANIVDAAVAGRGARAALFAQLDLAVNALTIVIQLFVSGRLIAALGVGFGLSLLGVVSGVGFAALAVSPVLPVVAGFQVLRRVANFAITRPAREVLYTVLGRDEKYKAKNFIDTFVYRGGDVFGAWSFELLTRFVAGPSGVALIAVPISAAWIWLAVVLGRRHRSLAASLAAADAGLPAGGSAYPVNST